MAYSKEGAERPLQQEEAQLKATRATHLMREERPLKEQSEAIRGDQKRSEAIRSNQKQSEAIRSNQRRSVLLT